MSAAKSPFTLSEAVSQAKLSWMKVGNGSSEKIVSELDSELNKPGSRASVVQWFIDGRYATSGSNIGASALINAHARHDEIDEAFTEILRFIEGLGDSGKALRNKLASMNRNLLSNYQV